MAILMYDGKKHTFVPRNQELFPSLTGPLVDCLGREIPAKSTHGYPFTIVFPRLRFAPGRDQQADALHTNAAVAYRFTGWESGSPDRSRLPQLPPCPGS